MDSTLPLERRLNSRAHAPLFTSTGPLSKTLDELSVVIPAYDEAANIAGLLGEIEACLDGCMHYEVIVVDDGSTDDALERLRDVRRERRLPLRPAPCKECRPERGAMQRNCRGPLRLDRDHGWRRTE